MDDESCSFQLLEGFAKNGSAAFPERIRLRTTILFPTVKTSHPLDTQRAIDIDTPQHSRHPDKPPVRIFWRHFFMCPGLCKGSPCRWSNFLPFPELLCDLPDKVVCRGIEYRCHLGPSLFIFLLTVYTYS